MTAQQIRNYVFNQLYAADYALLSAETAALEVGAIDLDIDRDTPPADAQMQSIYEAIRMARMLLEESLNIQP